MLMWKTEQEKKHGMPTTGKVHHYEHSRSICMRHGWALQGDGSCQAGQAASLTEEESTTQVALTVLRGDCSGCVDTPCCR